MLACAGRAESRRSVSLRDERLQRPSGAGARLERATALVKYYNCYCWYLVYVYRESRLREVLADENVRAFLAQEGYTLSEDGDCEPLLRQMARRLCCEAEFPHEIGVFLGYPLTDVVGFIENQGRNFTCCGCWKAYGDRDAAERLFAQLNKCTKVYLRLFHSGTPIFRLAVAA